MCTIPVPARLMTLDCACLPEVVPKSEVFHAGTGLATPPPTMEKAGIQAKSDPNRHYTLGLPYPRIEFALFGMV